MLLYSALLDINEKLTEDDFIKLVIYWNQKNSRRENVIQGLEWHGERSVRFGGDDLWLEIEEYPGRNIIAARFEKQVEGTFWDTDYIMNFDEMRMAVQLSRSYSDDAPVTDTAFSTPHFISILADWGCLADDHGLPVSNRPAAVTEGNHGEIAQIIRGESSHDLPVVYVSRTQDNEEPVDVNFLCSRLKGIAHVYAEEDRSLDLKMRQACGGRNEYRGAIGIYYPSGRHERFLYRHGVGQDPQLLEIVVRDVMQHANSQRVPVLYTWEGVSYSMLRERWSNQKRKREEAENEMQSFMDTFDHDVDDLQRKLDGLTRHYESLQAENQGLRRKLYSSGEVPLLFYGDESEFYEGEIREIVIDALAAEEKNCPEGTRYSDVLGDILARNRSEGTRAEKIDAVKKFFRDYRSLSGAGEQKMRELGLFITRSDGKHYKVSYYGDDRYSSTLPKTGSDHRGGKNAAAEIIKKMF